MSSYSMSAILERMAAADPDACREFVDRQGLEASSELPRIIETLKRAVFAEQCSRPQELMAWKFPERYESIGADRLKAVLRAVEASALEQLSPGLDQMSFADLCVLSSLSSHLEQALEMKRSAYRV